MIRLVQDETKMISAVSAPETSLAVTRRGLIAIAGQPKKITVLSGQELLANSDKCAHAWLPAALTKAPEKTA